MRWRLVVVGTSQVLERFRGPYATKESVMGLGKGALLWLIGVPIPIILLLVLFWR
jgi:hypothetical protein